jgi:hypothetical protein
MRTARSDDTNDALGRSGSGGHRVADEIQEADPQHSGELDQDGEPFERSHAAFDLGQPVLGPADKAGADLLGQTTTAPVEGDALADRRV